MGSSQSGFLSETSRSNVSALEKHSLHVSCKIPSALPSSPRVSKDTVTPEAGEVNRKGDNFSLQRMKKAELRVFLPESFSLSCVCHSTDKGERNETKRALP